MTDLDNPDDRIALDPQTLATLKAYSGGAIRSAHRRVCRPRRYLLNLNETACSYQVWRFFSI